MTFDIDLAQDIYILCVVNFIFEPLFVPDVVRFLKFASGYPTLINNNLCLHCNRERDRKHNKTNNNA